MQMKKHNNLNSGNAKDADGEEDGQECIYNAVVMHDKLEDIAWAQDQAWEETQVLTGTIATIIENVDDDLERELAFYNQALGSAKQAIGHFEEAGIAWRRPADYYAEMVKSDDHMAKVKEQLLYEQKVIETSQQRRKEREARKFSKQVAAERKKDRAQDKKAAITGVSALRKKREKEGFSGELDMDVELQRIQKGRQPKAKLGERFRGQGKSEKRAKRDTKFGFGGPKRLKKQNDAYSAAGGEFKQGSSGGKNRDGVKAQRPGKSRRQAMKRKSM